MRNLFTAAALAAVMGLAMPATAQTMSHDTKSDSMKAGDAMSAKPMDGMGYDAMTHDKMAMKAKKSKKSDHMMMDDKMKPADSMGH